MKSYLILFLALFSQAALATCQKPLFVDPSQVNPNTDSILIVTHASGTYDSRLSSKRGVDEAISYAKTKGIPVIYLQDKTPEEEYFMTDCRPDYRVFSQDGELTFEVKASHVYVVGGHLEQCLYRTIEGVINSWARQEIKDRTLTLLMDGIYSTGELVEEQDSYYNDFRKFTQVVGHRRNDADPMPKITLLETLGVINKEDNEIDFLVRALPNYGAVLSAAYKAELTLNKTIVKKIDSDQDETVAKITFDFMDSASRLDAI